MEVSLYKNPSDNIIPLALDVSQQPPLFQGQSETAAVSLAETYNISLLQHRFSYRCSANISKMSWNKLDVFME
jgi:hypothetical protein